MAEPYYKQLDRHIIQRYRREVKDGEIDLDEVTAWAIHEGLWEAPVKSQMAMLRKELANAMRAKTFTDDQGRRVRSNYCLRRETIDGAGKKVVQAVWASIDVATHPFIEKVFSQRRDQIADVCFQAAMDRDHWNEYRRGDNPQLEFSLDFTNDVADRMQSTDYRPEDMDEDDQE